MVVAVRGPLLVFLLPAAVLGPLARAPRVRASSVAAAAARRLRALGREPRRLARPVALRRGAPAPRAARLRARVLGDSPASLVWTLLIDPGSHGRLTVGGRVALAAAMFASGQVLTDVLVFSFHAALPGLPRRVRALRAHRPAARGRRDDGRAAAHARDARVRAAAAARCRRDAARHRVSATSFSFESALPRARRRRRRGVRVGGAAATGRPRWRAALFALGLFLIAASLNSPLETIAAQAAAAHPPAAERADRRRRAAPRPARADAGDARVARRARRAPHPRALRAARVARSPGTGRTSRASTTGRCAPAGR